MSNNSVVRARIDGQIKREATGVLAEMGLSVSDAIRLMLVRVAADRTLPFDVRSPNAATVAPSRQAAGAKSHDLRRSMLSWPI